MDTNARTIFMLCLLVGTSHAFSTALFSMVNKFNQTQQSMLKRLQDLEKLGAKTSIDLPERELELEFENKLELLERRVIALKNYLMQEKIADIELKVAAKETIDNIKLRVVESDTKIAELENDIQGSLMNFDRKISNVNKTAHLTVNVKGVVFIGSIGSTCSSDTEDCSNPKSECRDGKCQCDIGLSFDNEHNECSDTCEQYGCTFQSARQRIIREYNDKIAENVTLDECKKLCIDEIDFKCKSFDYFAHWETCYMSALTLSEIPDPNEAWEYNSAGTHFQRDCLGIKEISLCNENQP